MARTKEADRAEPKTTLEQSLDAYLAKADEFRKKSTDEILWPSLPKFILLQEKGVAIDKIASLLKEDGHSFSASQIRATLAKWEAAKAANSGKPVAEYAAAAKLLEKSPPAAKAAAGGQKPAAQPHG